MAKFSGRFHKTHTLTTELQELGMLQVGFEPTTKGYLEAGVAAAAKKEVYIIWASLFCRLWDNGNVDSVQKFYDRMIGITVI
jgi:hypothetical protein